MGMRLNSKVCWFLGFTAVFAALAAFVFWGTWSLDFVPVMPDCATAYSPDWFREWWRTWIAVGRFIPSDLPIFLGSPYFWQELNFVIPLYVSGLALAYYLRGRGLSHLACYGAGLLLSFCGYWSTLYSAGHISWFYCMTYILFPFGLLDRAVRKGKVMNWLLAGATVGWASYWQPDLWLLFMLCIGSYFVYLCVRERKFPWKGMLFAAAALLVIGGAGFRNAFVNDLKGREKQISEGQTVANSSQIDEAEKRWIFVTNWSLPADEVAEFFIPRLNGDTSCPLTLSIGSRYGTGVTPYTGALGRAKDAPTGNYRQHSLYVGLVTCLLALCGLVCSLVSGRRSDVWFWSVCAVVFCLCSFGRYFEPLYRLVYMLPFGDTLRAPVKWHHLTEFCLCALAGFGIEGLMSLMGRTGQAGRFVPWILGAVVLVGAIDLARVDHLYCAPVDMREARRQGCNMQMSFLRRADFDNPQVSAMVKARRIVSLAQVNPETYLVGVLTPWGKNTKPMPPLGVASWLGILSMLGSLGLAGYGLKKALAARGSHLILTANK